METPMTPSYPFILTFLSATALPLLAVLAILLRRNLVQGKAKIALLIVGIGLLIYTVVSTFLEEGGDLGPKELFVGAVTAVCTLFILSRFNHGHTHAQEEGGAKGIVISEAFHSLIDGAVIGATYLISPLLGGAATIGIVIHELPKIIGTLAVLRGLGLSMKKTIIYGIMAQIGSPVAAIFVFLLGKQFDHEQFHALEIASISSLGAIVLWIVYLEIKYHRQHASNAH
jgi:zinc and cadmium transporter